jgi:uncharacterized protein YkwD
MRGSGEGRLALPGATPRRACLALLLLLALFAAALPTVSAGAPAAPPTATISRVESKIVHCTNRQRAARGLPALRRNSVLRHAAKYHARNMLHYGFFAHRDVFGNSPVDRVSRFGRRGAFRWIGENIAVGFWSPSEACRAWMASPDHRANILDRRFTMIGVGFARTAGGRTYYVQDFGSPRTR